MFKGKEEEKEGKKDERKAGRKEGRTKSRKKGRKEGGRLARLIIKKPEQMKRSRYLEQKAQFPRSTLRVDEEGRTV